MNQDRQIVFNHLLDYRQHEQLLRMNDGDRAGLLAEILGRAASDASWQALWELFASWPANASREEHFAVAERALAAWPDRLRLVSSSDRRLFDGETLSPLARLVRSIEVYRREENGSAELRAIGSSAYAQGLTYLDVVRSGIDSDAWRALVESPDLPNLRHLHVSRSTLGPAKIEPLLRSSGFPRLHCLKLIDVGMQARDLEGVRQGMPFPALCAIDLSSNGLGNEGAVILSQSSWLRQLRRITLRDNFMQGQAFEALLSSPLGERLEQVDASGNRVTDAERPQLMALAATRQIQLIV